MFLGHVLAEDRDAAAESFGRAISSKTDWDCICRIRRKDGEIRWVWAKGKPELGERGEPVAVYGLVQDITERELARQESEILARFPTENPNPVLRVARDGEILYANPPSEPLLHLWNAARGGVRAGRLAGTHRGRFRGGAGLRRSRPRAVPRSPANSPTE